MIIIYSYKGYTISHIDNKYWITYPEDDEASIYTSSLDKAYKFIDEMEDTL